MLVHVPRRPGQRVVVIGREGGAFSPASIPDLVAWYDPSDLSTLFQDAAMTTPVTANNDPVGAMLDRSGNGNHLTQSTAGSRPLYKTSGGLHWLQSATNDFMTAMRTLNQPFDRVSAWRILTVQPNTTLAGGANAANIPALYVDGTGAELRIFSGTELTGHAVPAEGVDFVAVERHNGASSRLKVDNGAYTTGDVGASNSTVLTLFAGNEGADQHIVARCYGIFERPGGDLADSQIAQLVTYLAAKQGRVL